jgi:hypothetical protein
MNPRKYVMNLFHPPLAISRFPVLALLAIALAAAGASEYPRGRGINMGLDEASPAQLAALAQMESMFTEKVAAVDAARGQLTTTVYLKSTDREAIRRDAEAVMIAESALVAARADALTKLQSGPGPLSSELLQVLVWQAIRPAGGRQRTAGGGRGGPPAIKADQAKQADGFANISVIRRDSQNGPKIASLSDIQQTEITRLEEGVEIERLRSAVAKAKRSTYESIYLGVRGSASAAPLLNAWRDAEVGLAEAKASAFLAFQVSSPYRLNADQIETLAAGTTGGQGGL